MQASAVTLDPSNMYASKPSTKAEVLKRVVAEAPADAISATVV